MSSLPDAEMVLATLQRQPESASAIAQVFKSQLASEDKDQVMAVLSLLSENMKKGGPLFHSIVYQHLLSRLVKIAMNASNREISMRIIELLREWGGELLPHVPAFTAAKERAEKLAELIEEGVVLSPEEIDDENSSPSSSSSLSREKSSSASKRSHHHPPPISSPSSLPLIYPNQTAILAACSLLSEIFSTCGANNNNNNNNNNKKGNNESAKLSLVSDEIIQALSAYLVKTQVKIEQEMKAIERGGRGEIVVISNEDDEVAAIGVLLYLLENLSSVVDSWNRMLIFACQKLDNPTLPQHLTNIDLANLFPIKISISILRSLLMGGEAALELLEGEGKGANSAELKNTLRYLDSAQMELLKAARLGLSESPSGSVEEFVQLAKEIGDVLIAWNMSHNSKSDENSNNNNSNNGEDSSSLDTANKDEKERTERKSDAGYDSALVESGIVEVLEPWEVARQDPMQNDSVPSINPIGEDVIVVSGREFALDSAGGEGWEVVHPSEATES